MRHLLLIAAIAMLAGAAALLRVGAGGVPQGKLLTSDELSTDFGEIDSQVVRHDFNVRNISGSEIQVLGVVRSCGCTNAALDKTRLPPGATAQLACTYDLRGRSGSFSTAIDVVYRPVGAAAKDADSLVFAAHATVRPTVRLSDEEIVFEAGQATSKELRVDIAKPGCRVTGATIDHKCFSTAVSSDGTRIVVSFDPTDWAQGNGASEMIITTDCAHETRIRVLVRVLPNKTPRL